MTDYAGFFRVASFILAAVMLVSVPHPTRAELPENVALRAKASASSEHNSHYLARFAIDGKFPPPGSQGADLDAAWCVRGDRSRDRAEFTLEWEQPVDVAEFVYVGRTSWFLTECWKDFEVLADVADGPGRSMRLIAQGMFRMAAEPQSVRLSPTHTRRLTIRFLSSYGGPNPGAAEILVFAGSLASGDLARLFRQATRGPIPHLDEVSTSDLRRRILELHRQHVERYAQLAEHLARLDRSAGDPERLARLQRDVLLFDVDKLLVIKRHEIEASHVYTYHYEGQRNGGGLYVVSALCPKAMPVELVASPGGEILDASLSYDGRQVLFSWRRADGQGYHLWSVNIDGTALRQLTDGPWHDYNACWLPDSGIAFLSTRNPQFAYCWHAPVGVLYRADADGGRPQRLSANYLNDFTPSVLDDGRILYSRWEYVDRPAIPIQKLWTINPDGSGLAGYFGNRVLSPGTFMEAVAIPGTTTVLCTMTGHNGPTRGAIGVIDRTRGDNAQEAITNLTPDTPVQRVNEGDGNTAGTKLYSGPWPLDSDRFLCSARGPVIVRTMDGTCVSTVLDAPSDGMQWFGARPVRARPRPPVVGARYPTSGPDDTAVVFLQDVYQGLEPQVRRGEVKAIRVVRELPKPLRVDPEKRAFGFQFPVISCGATYAAKQVIGEVPVEDDGSACFRVPARQPLYFMALDGQGRAVQRMRSFTHFMPGEVHGCVGCHEHRQATPASMPTTASSRPPRDLTPPEWGQTGFDYARLVQPVLDRHCVGCHDAVDPPRGIDLTGGRTDFFNVSYETIARSRQGPRGTEFVNWIPTYNGQEQNILEITPRAWGSPRSKLADVVLSGHLDGHGRPRVSLDEASCRLILMWIDLNVPYYGTSETSHPELPGCRQIVPPGLDVVLAEVGQRRCVGCHAGGKVPRREWTRITEPELNPFLLAPLARSAGGSLRCGTAVFPDKDDPDYQRILAVFRPVVEGLRRHPRIDMPGGKPSEGVNRSCQ